MGVRVLQMGRSAVVVAGRPDGGVPGVSLERAADGSPCAAVRVMGWPQLDGRRVVACPEWWRAEFGTYGSVVVPMGDVMVVGVLTAAGLE